MINAIELLQAVPPIEQIVSIYVQHHLMPGKDLGDAYHLAIASYYEVDYLLTWNCRHLANVNKQEHIETVNKQIGLKVPRLITPDSLFSENAEDPYAT